MRIVIVEDEVRIREGMGKMIESQIGHQVVGEASDGEEGLRMVLNLQPDLVITDIRMPRMNGLQMLQKLSKSNVNVHAVVISGYSEFDYAQQAIRYGADDYLLKPLTIEDVSEMLEDVDGKIRRERALTYGQPEHRIRDILFGNVEESEEAVKEMQIACGFEPGMKYVMMGGYVGNAGATYKKFVEREVIRLRETYHNYKIYLLYQENRQMFFLLTAGKNLEAGEKTWYERNVYEHLIEKRESEEYPVWAKMDCTEGKFCAARQHLEEELEYGLVIKKRGWITDEIIHEYDANTFGYPLEIINRMKNALCQGEHEEVLKVGNAFSEHMATHQYTPFDMRHGFLKSYHLITDTLRDIDQTYYEHIRSSGVLRKLETVLTYKELKRAWDELLKILVGENVKREDISNYIIKKAINYIREHYREEIALEELSRKLEITPEYLSALFKREVGINFSLFIKRFRISHAKRLLKGSDLKVYEVAERVGYGDAKYFARVFKEELGVTPGEYRQMQ